MSAIVFIVDDDVSVRRSLAFLLEAHGYVVETFASAEEYLARDLHDGTGCLILDINLKENREQNFRMNSYTSSTICPLYSSPATAMFASV